MTKQGMKPLICACLFLIVSKTLFAYTLSWDIPVGDRLEIVKTADVELYTEGALTRVYQERTIIDLAAYEKTAKGTKFKGVFATYERAEHARVFRMRERYYSDFLITPEGVFVVPTNYIMPNVRHIPTFPKTPVEPGSQWSAHAEEGLVYMTPSLWLQLNVDYRFENVKTVNGTNLAVIAYRYIIDKDMSAPRFRQFASRGMPLKAYGYNYATALWDVDRNKPFGMHEQYRIMLVHGDARAGYQSREFRMNIDSAYTLYSGKANRENELAYLRNALPDGEKGVDIATIERGIVLRMGDILFDFDSTALRKDARKNLDLIVTALNERYPDREIIVEGHTDNVGSAEYNLNLSERRAEAVAEYLRTRAENDKMSYIGRGANDPVANNATESGREQNRRVDIIIKLD